jgi:ribose transport system substrate-binding protein
MIGARKTRSVAALSAAALLAFSSAACSKDGGGSTDNPGSGASTAPAIRLSGTVTFNQDNLSKLDATLKSALAGKSLSGVNIAMVVNVAADYWKAGQIGFLRGCADLGIPTSKCSYYAPPNGKLTEQNSELEPLHSQGVTGYSISAIDPTSAAGTIHADASRGVDVLAIDSPLPGTEAASLYLGTPNYTAGFQAGTAMKQVLGGKGKVAILVGSLTAANATQRIQGFEDALKGTGITIAQKQNDNLSAATATSEAEAILSNNPDVNGLYGVYSYDGPALARAVQSAGKTSSVAQTLQFVQSGVIAGTVVQMPWQQGYTGAYILASEKVLGKNATMAIIKPYLESDGSTLSSGVGLVTKSDLTAYQSLESQLGIS